MNAPGALGNQDWPLMQSKVVFGQNIPAFHSGYLVCWRWYSLLATERLCRSTTLRILESLY